MTLTLRSEAFPPEGEIPVRHTCDGENVSPPLRISGVPPQARSLALLVEDPDAPDPAAPRMIWVHWLLLNLPPETAELPEGVAAQDLPPGTVQGMNDWRRSGYGGPCPPVGRHRYLHRLYALDRRLDCGPRTTRAEFLRAARGHVLAEAVLIGRYGRVLRDGA